MFISKLIMEFFPNIHLIGVFTVAMTVVYRVKALIPVYVFVFLTGAFYAFLPGGILWWIPYLYIWAILWGMAMLIPKKMPKWLKPFVYAVVCSLHGFLYGILYAPAQSVMFFGWNFDKMIVWILQGIPSDIVHGVSNFVLGFLLITPLVMVMSIFQKHADKNSRN